LYYRKYCKTLAKVIKEAKKVYYDSVILKSHNKIKTTWSIIKKETGYKNHTDEPQSLKINNIIIKDKGHIANAFNEYFSSVAQAIIDDLNTDNNESLTNIIPLHYLDSRYNSTFENIRWHYTSIAEIRKIMKSLKIKSSYGYDEISTKMLKVSMPYIFPPLTYICNESLAQGIFPDRLKFAMVKQILKNGDKCEPSNYGPISLLSSFSKVFERLIYN
jgi:Notch-like protein